MIHKDMELTLGHLYNNNNDNHLTVITEELSKNYTMTNLSEKGINPSMNSFNKLANQKFRNQKNYDLNISIDKDRFVNDDTCTENRIRSHGHFNENNTQKVNNKPIINFFSNNEISESDSESVNDKYVIKVHRPGPLIKNIKFKKIAKPLISDEPIEGLPDNENI